MNMRFDGKRALVTGAGKGIGREIAKALVKCGAQTIALSRTQADLVSLKAEMPEIITVQAELGDWEGTRKITEGLGPIDLLVNNAAIMLPALFLDVKKEEFDETMKVNVCAVLNVSQVVAKGMVERGNGGSIVNVSSESSKRAVPGCTSYCTSKGGLDMLTQMMALELGPHKIRVNSVHPTVTMTPMAKMLGWEDPAQAGPLLKRIPLGQLAELKDVVEPVLFLLSDKAEMIHGAFLPIDGGLWIG